MALGDRMLQLAVQDRQQLFREGLAMVLSAEPDLDVTATAGTATELVMAVANAELDVVILELDTPDWDACRLVAGLRKRSPHLRVVGTCVDNDDRLSTRAYQAGVRALFPKTAGIRTLLQTIRTVPQSAMVRGPRREATRIPVSRPLLTPREVEVLGAIGSGATTRGVAAAMGISPKTVENHKQRIFEKLGVQNQAHAVSIALRRGLLSPTAALFGVGA